MGVSGVLFYLQEEAHLIFNFALRVKCFSHFVDEEKRGWRGQSLSPWSTDTD